MKKIILSKVAVNANPANVVKAMTKKYGAGVFYDADTHSVVKLEEEVVEKIVEKVEKEATSERLPIYKSPGENSFPIEEKPRKKRKKK